MAKKNGLGISKKNFPGLKRVNSTETDEWGETYKVWEYQGKQFKSLRELDRSKNPSKYMSMKFTRKFEEPFEEIYKDSLVKISEDSDLNLEINHEEISKKDFQLNQTNKKFIGGPTEVMFLPNVDENNKEIK